MASSEGGDRGPRRYCEPHDGTRTPSFRHFKRDFATGARAQFLSEDDYSIWQVLQGTDQGGHGPNAPAMPGAAQAGGRNVCFGSIKNASGGGPKPHAPELCTTTFGLEDVVNGAYGVDISLVWI